MKRRTPADAAACLRHAAECDGCMVCQRPPWTDLEWLLLQLEAVGLFNPAHKPGLEAAAVVVKNAIASERAARSRRSKPGEKRALRYEVEQTPEALRTSLAEWTEVNQSPRGWLKFAVDEYQLDAKTIRERLRSK